MLVATQINIGLKINNQDYNVAAKHPLMFIQVIHNQIPPHSPLKHTSDLHSWISFFFLFLFLLWWKYTKYWLKIPIFDDTSPPPPPPPTLFHDSHSKTCYNCNAEPAVYFSKHNTTTFQIILNISQSHDWISTSFTEDLVFDLKTAGYILDT